MATNCTATVLDSAEYCDSEENKTAGFEDTATVWVHDDVLTYPAYKTVADVPNNVTEMMAKRRAAGPIVMKTGKKPYILPCIIEQNSVTVKGTKGGYMTEATVRIQNTEHNIGVANSLKGARFTLGMKPVDKNMLLIGQSNGINSQFLAMMDQESLMIDFGKEFGSDKYIEFKVVAKPFAPVTYVSAISYEPAT